ncbi:LysR family transcriptional regulator, partial [Streptomyces regensis]
MVLPIDAEGLDVTPLLRDEVVYVSADPRRITQPVTMADLAAAKLILYDAHYGWRDPTRRQLA